MKKDRKRRKGKGQKRELHVALGDAGDAHKDGVDAGEHRGGADDAKVPSGFVEQGVPRRAAEALVGEERTKCRNEDDPHVCTCPLSFPSMSLLLRAKGALPRRNP